MQNLKKWQGLPYYPISLFYKQTFGEKVWKIPLSLAETCPNREGLKGMKTCNFCDEWGSAAYPEYRDLKLQEQFLTTQSIIRERYGAQSFLVYFQSYTNTFQKVSRLKEAVELCKGLPGVRGFVFGTRPDCLSDSIYELWNELAKTKFVSVELGVQSFDEKQLLWMRRGHTAAKSLFAIHKIKEKCPHVDLGIHLIFGLPQETDEDILEACQLVNSLPIDNVKLHNLHILANTPLAEDYAQGLFAPLSKEEYTHRVILFLQSLNPQTSVHRLTAVASRHKELVAPAWAANKMASYQFVLDEFSRKKAYQGQYYNSYHNANPNK